MNKTEMAERLRAAQLLIKSVSDHCIAARKPGMAEWAKSIACDTGDLAMSVDVSEWADGLMPPCDWSDAEITSITNSSYGVA